MLCSVNSSSYPHGAEPSNVVVLCRNKSHGIPHVEECWAQWAVGWYSLNCMLQRLCTAAKWIRARSLNHKELRGWGGGGVGDPDMGSDSAFNSGLGQGNGVRSIVLMRGKCGMAMQSEQAAAWAPHGAPLLLAPQSCNGVLLLAGPMLLYHGW